MRDDFRFFESQFGQGTPHRDREEDKGMNREQANQLRNSVRGAYSNAAKKPEDRHLFPVGAQFAENIGYPKELLASLPSGAADAFTGVSNVSVFAHIPAGSVVLDLGCGAGLDSLVAARKAGSEGAVIGVDFSESMLTRAHQAAMAANATNIGFRQADGEYLPIGAEQIDVALVNGIFNLNPKRDFILAELARVTRPSGVVYAAELILKAPLPPEVQNSEDDWFA
jgi:arsenite methyltransferase